MLDGVEECEGEEVGGRRGGVIGLGRVGYGALGFRAAGRGTVGGGGVVLDLWGDCKGRRGGCWGFVYIFGGGGVVYICRVGGVEQN